MSRRGQTTRETDWLTIFLYLGIVGIGFLMIYAVGYSEHPDVFDFSAKHGVQLRWIGISLVVGIFTLILDARFFRFFAYPIYGFSVLLLVAVLLFGVEIAGSRSWFNIPFLGRFQPAEFAKFGACLALAAFLSGFNVSLSKSMKQRLQAMAIILIPMGLILLQGDAGSALVFTALFIVLFRAGMPALLYMIGLIVVALSVIALLFEPLAILGILSLFFMLVFIGNFRERQLWWLLAFTGLVTMTYLGYQYDIMEYMLALDGTVLLLLAVLLSQRKRGKLVGLIMGILVMSTLYAFSVNYAFNNILESHQQDRLNVWLKPGEVDPLGAGYNLRQSKLAIGSGGLAGRGFLKGEITRLKYVPEQSTDFIFCTIGEEHGFIGSFVLIGLYISLILRITFVAERQREVFSRMYAYGVASILFFHFFINIGMTMGVMPIIGIPLPLVSYGGSSLLSFTILLAVLIKLDNTRLTRI